MVGFARISGFPCVTGGIDGTRIPNQRYRGLNSNGAEVRRRLIHDDSKSNMIKDICV